MANSNNDQTPEPLEVIRDASPQEIALQYIHHEFIKLFPGRPASFYQELTKGVEQLPQTLGDDLLWKLLAGIAEGYKFKWVYRFLTHTGLSWRLETVRLSDILMTGMSPFMDPILAKAHWQPLEFAHVWRSDPSYAKQSAPGIKPLGPEPERDHLPIMLVEKDHQLKVFDGMRRTCVAALAGQPSLTAWVGRQIKPGKSKLNAYKTLFLFATYNESEHRDTETLIALIGVSRMVIREYANGREAVERALQFWDTRDYMRDAAAKVREAIKEP